MDVDRSDGGKLSNNYSSTVHTYKYRSNYGVQIKETLPCYRFGPCLFVIHTIPCIFCSRGTNTVVLQALVKA